jgi:hypothetical protein
VVIQPVRALTSVSHSNAFCWMNSSVSRHIPIRLGWDILIFMCFNVPKFKKVLEGPCLNVVLHRSVQRNILSTICERQSKDAKIRSETSTLLKLIIFIPVGHSSHTVSSLSKDETRIRTSACNMWSYFINRLLSPGYGTSWRQFTIKLSCHW